MVNDAQKKEENKKNSQTHPLNSLRSAVQCQTTRQLIHQVVARQLQSQHFPFAHAAWPCCFERNCKNIWWLWKGTTCVFDWKWSFTFIWHYDRWLPFQSHKITNIIISNLFAESLKFNNDCNSYHRFRCPNWSLICCFNELGKYLFSYCYCCCCCSLPLLLPFLHHHHPHHCCCCCCCCCCCW